MQTWTFRGREMTIRNLLLILPVLATAACTSVYEDDAQGQIVYHWERPRTGVIKFSRDHSECLRAAENWSWTPDINSWFYSEEAKLDIRADWHAERGIFIRTLLRSEHGWFQIPGRRRYCRIRSSRRR